ncbi:MAG: hypothetical protein IVW36_07295 [Dehalococcoidia bacterium]|nr:hypothetical protein [Dehalococcoidia bacterium]
MSKQENGQDRIQREIEEVLDKLDAFVPEERFTEKLRNRGRRRRSDQPGALERATVRLRRVSTGQLMLGGLGLILFAYFFRAPLGPASGWLIIGGLIAAGVGFVLALVRGGRGGTIGGGSVEKRWRGQVIRYSTGPSAADRVRNWFRNRRRG